MERTRYRVDCDAKEWNAEERGGAGRLSLLQPGSGTCLASAASKAGRFGPEVVLKQKPCGKGSSAKDIRDPAFFLSALVLPNLSFQTICLESFTRSHIHT